MLGGIAFAAQVAEGGGAGSWVTGLTALVCFTISAMAFFKGTKKFAPLDWFSLFAAFVALFLWRATHGPTLSVILVTITDAVGFLPTYRKGFYKPYEETATMFALSALKWMIGIFALETYALATWLYPASLIATNGAFVMLLLVRRKQLAPQN